MQQDVWTHTYTNTLRCSHVHGHACTNMHAHVHTACVSSFMHTHIHRACMHTIHVYTLACVRISPASAIATQDSTGQRRCDPHSPGPPAPRVLHRGSPAPPVCTDRGASRCAVDQLTVRVRMCFSKFHLSISVFFFFFFLLQNTKYNILIKFINTKCLKKKITD